MIFKFFESVGCLGGVNQLANFDDGLVIRKRQVPDFIVGRKHGRPLSRLSKKLAIIATIVWRPNRSIVREFLIAKRKGVVAILRS
jgi:hypothetical protein